MKKAYSIYVAILIIMITLVGCTSPSMSSGAATVPASSSQSLPITSIEPEKTPKETQLIKMFEEEILNSDCAMVISTILGSEKPIRKKFAAEITKIDKNVVDGGRIYTIFYDKVEYASSDPKDEQYTNKNTKIENITVHDDFVVLIDPGNRYRAITIDSMYEIMKNHPYERPLSYTPFSPFSFYFAGEEIMAITEEYIA